MEQNKNKQQNQEDVNPSSQFDKLVKDTRAESLPETGGTGGNREVFTESSLIIHADNPEKTRTDEQPEN